MATTYPPRGTFIIQGTDTSSLPRKRDGSPADLPPRWRPADYERAVVFNLDRLRASAVGRTIYEAVRALTTSTRVVRFAPDFTPGSAHVRPVSGPLNEPTVFYSPGKYQEGRRCMGHRRAVLAHELAHAGSALRSGFWTRPAADHLGNANGYPDEEELLGMLVQNIYGSGEGLVLRSGYDDFERDDPTFDRLFGLAGGLPPGVRLMGSNPNIHDYLRERRMEDFTDDTLDAFSLHFAACYSVALRRFLTDSPVCAALAALRKEDAPFNPLRSMGEAGLAAAVRGLAGVPAGRRGRGR